MKIDVTNISRKHVRLNISREGDVQLTCIHKSSIFVKQKTGEDSWKDLHEGKTVTLENGDEFKFLSNNFHFQLNKPVSSRETSAAKEDTDTIEKLSPEATKFEQNAEEKDTEYVIEPKPTGKVYNHYEEIHFKICSL